MATVLVVDDSVIDRRRAAGLLERAEPHVILYADDGNAALEQLKSAAIDVVLTDLSMPGMDGLQLVTEMRENHPQIPVILMTSQGSEETAVSALRAGAASYVPKRRLAADLSRTIASVLAASKADRMTLELLGHRLRVVTTFSLPPVLELVTAMPRHVQQTMADIWNIPARELMKFAIAVEEALLNALCYGTLGFSSATRHSNATDLGVLVAERTSDPACRDRRIFVETRVTPAQGTVVIRDEGPGFDTSQLPDPDDPASLAKHEGRGLRLMQMFADELTYSPSGNEVTLTKRRRRRR